MRLLIFVQRRLVVLSMPKSASTAVETALFAHCDVAVRNPPVLKHASYSAFARFYAPILRKKCELPRGKYEVVCIFREPISWLNSWYRYRAREELRSSARTEKYTGNLSFAEFLEAYLQDPQPAFAKVGDQISFVTKRDGSVGVDRIFKYEALDEFRQYVSKKLKAEIDFPITNVSPRRDYDAPEELVARVRERLAPAVRLHKSL